MQARISAKTRNNWLIDAALLLGGILATLSGIYFLFLPTGGYQGGRNPMYGVTILFSRHTWDAVHTWTGVAMIVAAVVHLAVHWTWVKMMARRTAKALFSKGNRLSRGAKTNVALDAAVAVSFLLTAVSGVYFLFAPSGNSAAGQAGFLLSRTAWDMIHTWAGVVLVVAVVLHLAIHWRWVVNVGRRLIQSFWPQTVEPARVVKPGGQAVEG